MKLSLIKCFIWEILAVLVFSNLLFLAWVCLVRGYILATLSLALAAMIALALLGHYGKREDREPTLDDFCRSIYYEEKNN